MHSLNIFSLTLNPVSPLWSIDILGFMLDSMVLSKSVFPILPWDWGLYCPCMLKRVPGYPADY